MSETRTLQGKRIPEIEMMRAFAIISMVFVHVHEMAPGLDLDSPPRYAAAYIIELLGCIPSGAVFVFAMGFGAAMSERRNWVNYINRSVVLFLLGIIVNFFEVYIPALMVPDTYGPLTEILPSILSTDVYFFAALMSLYLALMKRLESKNTAAVIISVSLVAVCACINAVWGFNQYTTGNEWLDTILGLFIRLNEYSFYPLISWCVFPVAGYGLGRFIKRYGMKKAVILSAVTAALALVLSYSLLYYFKMPDTVIKEVVEISDDIYYRLHPLNALTGCGMIATEFLIVHFILLASRGKAPKFMQIMSRNVTPIYITQWIIIGLISPLLARVSNIWINTLIALPVLVLSCLTGDLLKKANLIKL